MSQKLFIPPMFLLELFTATCFFCRKPFWILLIELLVVILCQVERLDILYLGNNFSIAKLPAFCQPLFRCFSDSPLLIVLNKDHRSVVIATVLKLPHRVCRVGLVPVNGYKVIIGNHSRIKGNPYRLRMTGGSCFHLFIGGVSNVAPSIAGLYLFNAWIGVKWLYHAPKTTTRKNSSI